MNALVPPQPAGRTVARVIAELLAARGVTRVFGLVGGHIQPIWDELPRVGIEVVDTRHECAAVYMAHAHAMLTGSLGIALVTAGPGLTNAVTGIANASISRVPVLIISGRVPRPQTGMGGMQDIPQAAIVGSICRRVETVSDRTHVLSRMDTVIRAAFGAEGAPGPVYIDFPTDVLRETLPCTAYDAEWLAPWRPHAMLPDPHDIAHAAEVLRTARRPMILAGREAHGATAELLRVLELTGAVYIDTTESRGVIPQGHPQAVPAMRARAMREADVVITLGRKLDFQVGYGSPAVFSPQSRFIRIGRDFDDVAGNRRAAAELRADVRLALAALADADIRPTAPDAEWRAALVEENARRAEKLRHVLRQAPPGADGRMHPYTLISELNRHITDDTIVVADGGDILSFARVALDARNAYLDPGSLGCIGVGVPFANAAALDFPGRRVVALIGDGAFGLTAMEISTAVRKKAAAVYVIANNEGWNIDRHDQIQTYGGHIVGVDLPHCRYDQLAIGLGAHGERVEDPADLPQALERAFRNAPAVVDVLVSREPTSPDFESGLAYVYPLHALRRWHEAEAELTRGDAPAS